MRASSCQICDHIAARTCVTTGRGEAFAPPITSLETIVRDKDELWRCPTCGGLYFWTDYAAYYIGGSDDETLTRAPEMLTAVVQAFMQREADDDGELHALVAELAALEASQRELVVSYLKSRRGGLLVTLIPHYLAEDARRDRSTLASELAVPAKRDVELSWHLLAAIERSPTDLFDGVARQLCAVCGGIARKSIETGDIGPRNTMLQLNRTSIDVWKCPRCRAHFAWHEPKLVRMDLRSERCLHAILQHDGASLADELVREFLGLGEDVVQAILRYARERDEDLLRKLTRYLPAAER